ncbi:MAG TPA: hypothetical protein VLY21_07335 [Nitrososphaerales archaeon]|nr:hypothetical protein [Nitrososphaerales archaeon]
MNSRRIVAVLLVVSLALVPMLPLPAVASSSYTENITIYVAGSSAMWTMRLGGINASNSHITKLEAVSGLNWYNITAVNMAGITSDYQIFGPRGYNLIQLPFVPQQGVFLTAGATSYAAAQSAAEALEPYLVTTFSSVGNGSGVYTFFAPGSLGEVAPATLMRFIPVGLGGFENVLGYTSDASPGNFTSLPGATITLGGERSSSGFGHYLILSAMSSKALASSQPTILTVFGRTLTSLQAANKSASSVIEVRALDGIILANGTTGVSNDLSSFTGSYTYAASPGSKVRSLNVTLLQQPPELLVTRTLDAGILTHDQNVSVTVNFRNLSNSTTVTHVVLDDNWWLGYPFKLVGGTSTLELPRLSPGATLGLTYELEYTGSSSQQAVIPASTAMYKFVALNPQTGKSYNSTMQLFSSVNGGMLLLSPSQSDPVLNAYLTTSSGINGAVGSTQGLSVVVKNLGSRTANNVTVNHQQVGSLPAGQSITVPMAIRAPSLTLSNLTEGYTVSYLTPENANVSLTTNSLHVVFSHSSMNLGLGTLTVNATTAKLPGGITNLTLSFTTANKGSANLTTFSASGTLPSGLSCGRSFGKGISCSNGVVSLDYSNVKTSQKASMNINITQAKNFIVQPLSFNFTSSGYSFSGTSSAVPVPTGLVVSKSFSPNLLFGRMRSSVSVEATNSGPFSFYNATVSTPNDQFDSVVPGEPPTTTSNATLSAGRSLSLAYNVTLGQTTGNQTGAAVTGSYYFGGNRFTVSQASGSVLVYKLPSVTITSTPASPVEGKSFSITIKLSNPSPLSLSNMQFTLPIPADLRVSSATNAVVADGKIQINVAQLAGNSAYTANLTASANSGISIPFSGETFSFVYSGQTVAVPALTTGIAVNENVITRYVLPIGLALVVLLAVAVVLRRMARATSPAPPQ